MHLRLAFFICGARASLNEAQYVPKGINNIEGPQIKKGGCQISTNTQTKHVIKYLTVSAKWLKWLPQGKKHLRKKLLRSLFVQFWPYSQKFFSKNKANATFYEKLYGFPRKHTKTGLETLKFVLQNTMFLDYWIAKISSAKQRNAIAYTRFLRVEMKS